MARACDDGREDGARGVVTGETSLAHACLHEQRQKVEEQSQKVLGAVPSGSADEGGEGGWAHRSRSRAREPGLHHQPFGELRGGCVVCVVLWGCE